MKPIMLTKNNGQSKEYNQSTKNKNPLESLFYIIYKTVTVSIIFLLAIVICYFISLFIIENGDEVLMNAKQKLHTLEKQQQFISKWERIKSRLNSIYKASTIPLSSLEINSLSSSKKKIYKIGKVELGKKLLKNGDFVGAETLCKAEIESGNLKYHHEHMNALVCLGEARIALHNAAWNLGFLESEYDLVYDRLHLAKKDFDAAVSLEPTFLGARLGLGLTNFLIATREQPESSSQLLFNSILHFEAISVLTSDSEDNGKGEWISGEDIENIQISAMYNNGLAHLALGDIKPAVSIFTKVSNLMNSNQNQSAIGKGISSVVTNLGAALLQRGASEQAINIMNRAEVLKYCDGGIQSDERDGETPYTKQRYLHKQCSILLNNLAISEEVDDLDVKNDKITFNSSESLMELSRKYEGKLGLQVASFASTNIMERIENEQLESIVIEDIGMDHEVSSGTNQEESIISNNVDDSTSPQLLLSMALEKLNANDVEGVVDATITALCLAKDTKDTIACKAALNDTLERKKKQDITVAKHDQSDQDNSAYADQILHLEQEILKLQSELQHYRVEKKVVEYDGHDETKRFISSADEVRDNRKDLKENEEIEQHFSHEAKKNAEYQILEEDIDSKETISVSDDKEISRSDDNNHDKNSTVLYVSAKDVKEETHQTDTIILEQSDYSIEEEPDVQLPELYNPVKKSAQEVE